jgi:hypothetical protein
VIRSAVSILSFLLALIVFVQSQIKKAVEKTNMEVMREKIENLYQGLVSIYYANDAIVQMPKSQQIDTAMLQNLSRISRAQVFILLKKIEKERVRPKEWKFGAIIKSDPLEDVDPENKLGDRNEYNME